MAARDADRDRSLLDWMDDCILSGELLRVVVLVLAVQCLVRSILGLLHWEDYRQSAAHHSVLGVHRCNGCNWLGRIY